MLGPLLFLRPAFSTTLPLVALALLLLLVFTQLDVQAQTLAASWFSTYHVCDDGSLLVRGTGSSRALGSGVVRIPSNDKVVRVWSSYDRAVFYTEGRDLWVVGNTGDGVLGDTRDERIDSTPRLLFEDVLILDVALSFSHTLVLFADGSVQIAGYFVGAYGDGNSEGQLLGFRTVPLPEATSIYAGAKLSVVVDNEGQLWGWGENREYFDLRAMGNLYKPIRIDSARRYRRVSGATRPQLSFNTIAAVDTAGHVYCWGTNTEGQAGMPPGGTVGWPTKVEGLPRVVQVVGGANHMYAITADGEVYAWGGVYLAGLVPDSLHGITHKAVRVPIAEPVKEISAYHHHCVVKLESGRLLGWGANANEQLRETSSDWIDSPISVDLQCDSTTSVSTSPVAWSSAIRINVVPSPTVETATLQFSEEIPDGATLFIVESTGRTLLAQPIRGMSTVVDVRGIPSGVMYLLVWDNGRLLTQSLLSVVK